MGTRRTRSAALLISIYVDADGGAPWYAQLRAFQPLAFDDPAEAEVGAERVSEEGELVAAIRRWLNSVIDEA